MPRFPLKDGWLGGDAAYSVPLSSGRSLWFFGDTFIGAARASSRRGARMIANSAAVSECRGGEWSISYRWRRGPDGEPAPLFAADAPGEKLWPLDGFMHEGRLYLALSRVAADAKDPLGFALVGVSLARVDDPGGDPRSWKPRIVPLWSDGRVFPGVAIAREGGWAYMFAAGPKSAQGQSVLLSRVALGRLDRAQAALEFLQKDGTWKRAAGAGAAVVMRDGATEMSVRRHGAGWLAVHPGGFGASAALYRRAPRLEGPWSRAKPLFAYETRRERDFCYAAKEHAHLRRPSGELVATYACNTLDFSRLTADMSLYAPKAVVVPAP